jgi:hypothetical protein
MSWRVGQEAPATRRGPRRAEEANESTFEIVASAQIVYCSGIFFNAFFFRLVLLWMRRLVVHICSSLGAFGVIVYGLTYRYPLVRSLRM